MIKPIIFFSLIFSVVALHANENNTWTVSQASKNNHYNINLQCDHPPTLEGFQSCHLTLSDKIKKIANANILIEGGMPEHHHGLPTSPKIQWDSDTKTYIINGLKFSMPGAWELIFLIDKTKNLPQDTATISFKIN